MKAKAKPKAGARRGQKASSSGRTTSWKRNERRSQAPVGRSEASRSSLGRGRSRRASTIARRQEVHHAQRETHLDNKTKYLAGMGNTGKDEKGPKGRGKGKDQVKGKGDRDGKKGAKDQGKGQESK